MVPYNVSFRVGTLICKRERDLFHFNMTSNIRSILSLLQVSCSLSYVLKQNLYFFFSYKVYYCYESNSFIVWRHGLSLYSKNNDVISYHQDLTISGNKWNNPESIWKKGFTVLFTGCIGIAKVTISTDSTPFSNLDFAAM